jgi:hypothetical protein
MDHGHSSHNYCSFHIYLLAKPISLSIHTTAFIRICHLLGLEQIQIIKIID